MIRIEALDDLDLRALGKSAFVTVGTFDGVHRGHAALIRHMRERAHASGALAAIFTFQNHPRSVVAPQLCPPILTPWDRKAELLAELQPDVLIGLPFTREFSQTPAESFVTDILLERCAAREIASGADFRFGAGGTGSPKLLAALAADRGCTYHAEETIVQHSGRISSTRIREALAAGQVEDAKAMLGRPHRIEGTVVSGDRLGRTIGFPTANLEVDPLAMRPADGVYAARAILADGALRDAIVNLGWRPTVSGRDHRIEAHLLDFDDALDGQTLALDFERRLRGEHKFPSLDALRQQLERDRATARTLLA